MRIDQADRDALFKEALPRADIEKAIRWVAYGLPPLAPNREKLHDYPPVFDKGENPEEHCQKFGIMKADLIQTSWRKLLHQLAYDKLGAFAQEFQKYKRETEGVIHAFPMYEWKLRREETRIPVDLWEPDCLTISSSWSIEYCEQAFHAHAIFIRSQNREFRKIWVDFSKLANALPFERRDTAVFQSAKNLCQVRQSYRNRLLCMLDELRAEISSDGKWRGYPPKKESLVDEARKRFGDRGISDNEAKMIATFLIPDQVRQKRDQ